MNKPNCISLRKCAPNVTVVKPVSNDPLWKYHPVWKDHFLICENFYPLLVSMQTLPVWKDYAPVSKDHFFLTPRVVVQDRFDCSTNTYFIMENAQAQLKCRPDLSKSYDYLSTHSLSVKIGTCNVLRILHLMMMGIVTSHGVKSPH